MLFPWVESYALPEWLAYGISLLASVPIGFIIKYYFKVTNNWFNF
ncbi:putative membrane protein [Vibrio cholerae HC-51A1]|nr:putative membrane protein [Vibrio cholerae HC-02A1]EKG54500.1 putative membrane protein [Vibrio cholerae HC-50A1]EKG59713.1 putative membrane protein [Vibrio cholerae HC-52A1]EKG63081.1 putative membrane protein [Vibrio cholerae HC-56A1]EKG74253.1 putative membrane protein [Vibrio cholerae HC-57A1]EKG94365.1 putative membrane protein [Vibrio cholerae HC-51A1]EKL09259.1 putative membrane protein [Vibrio cholerae HC-55C2]EKL16257.1 putative membrane protein [Vibrio cholerae HC-60A1]EKL1732